MTIKSRDQWQRPRPPAPAGGGSRGCTLRLTEETAFVQNNYSTIVPFDDFAGEDWRSTTTLDSADFGANSIPIGQAVVIPDDMPPDSEYTVSADMGMYPGGLAATIDGQWGLQFAVLKGDAESWPGLVGKQNVLYAPPATTMGIAVLHVPIPREIYKILLNPGDYLYCVGWAIGDTSAGPQSVTGRAQLTVEYFRTPA